ncbi:MAG: type II secretion system F family protein [Limnochordia bacterium]|nr:type II secretion system F family protein [Limnochordia bacterium]
MPRSFNYKVRNIHGQISIGTIEAEDRITAAKSLKTEGNYIIELKEEPIKKSFLHRELGGPRRLKIKALSLFCRQFAVLVRTGVPMVNTLDLLASQSMEKELKETLTRARRAVSGGSSLADAFRDERIFPPIFVNMIETGEVAGTLDEVLENMSRYFESQNKMRNQLQQALMYPTVVSIFAVVMIFIVLFVVLPRFASIYAGFGVSLPALTQFILDLRDWLMRWWFALLAGLAGLVLAIRQYSRTPKGKLKLHGWLLRVPIIGSMLSRMIFSRFCRTLGLMINSGVPMVSSLEASLKVIENEAVAQDVRRAKQGVERGQGIAIPLRQATTFPPLLKQMIEIGEESGSLGEVLGHVAEFYEEELEHMATNISAMIEPIMLAVMAVVVAIIAMSIVLPMFQITSAIS